MNASVMKRLYKENSASHTYIVGFIREDKVYYVTCDWNQLRKWLRESVSASSKGGVKSLRVYVPADDQRKAIANGTAKILCKAEQLTGKNQGDAFEKAVVETLTNTVWTKDRSAFYEKGDMELNGEQIQIKLNTATLTDEKIIKNMVKKLGK